MTGSTEIIEGLVESLVTLEDYTKSRGTTECFAVSWCMYISIDCQFQSSVSVEILGESRVTIKVLDYVTMAGCAQSPMYVLLALPQPM
jgi:hypothetical protein